MQEVEIVPRARTLTTEGGHTSWVDMEVVAPGVGVLAVFSPSREEIERGEGELASEHLRRQAEALRDEVGRVRRAFRTTLERSEPPSLLRPFFATVEVEDGVTGERPSPMRAALVFGAGVALGVAGLSLGGAGSLVHWIGLALFGVLAVVAAWGAERSSWYRGGFEATAGLPVALRAPGDQELAPPPESGEHEGPYHVAAEVLVVPRGQAYRALPRVVVLDGDDRVVKACLPEDETAPELEARVLLQKAEALADALEETEVDAREVADGDEDGPRAPWGP